MKIVSIKHNGTEFGEMTQSGVKVADCAGTYIADDISATVTSVQDYDSTIITGDKPTNLNILTQFTGQKITNGYTCPPGISMSGNDSGITGGTYIATYTPKTGHIWSDGTIESVTVTLIILADVLCFTAEQTWSRITMSVTGTPTLSQNFQTLRPGGTWQDFIPGTTTIILRNVGDKVYFKGNNPSGVNESYSTYYKFNISSSISASGNIMSLIDNGACTCTTIPNNYCFNNLFVACSGLISSPELPATVLTEGCYSNMFSFCYELITSPALPARTLTKYCYQKMFYCCNSLRSASTLLATILAESCCEQMFSDCTSLTTLPELSATTLAKYCCRAMFSRCTSLTIAPVLPAISLVYGCYDSMFSGCTSLTTAPALPATTLADYCYRDMFRDCTSLIVSDTYGSGYNNAWRIPTSETFTSTYEQEDMFENCAGTRSSDTMGGVAGESYTYYTQNPPV